MHIDDRFEPETIADHENHAPTKVTDRDGEHAAEPLQEVDSPMFVCMQNELGIGTSTEMKPFVPQHGRVRAPVVDFAVVGDPDIADVIRNRRVGFPSGIDDRQTRVEQCIRCR